MDNQPTINVGTLGHVSHGKSTLIKALTGDNTGKYKDEIVKNMTIKLGYSNVKIFKCSKCESPGCYKSSSSKVKKIKCCNEEMRLVKHISFVDSPGHHDLLTTMLSGASVMDASMMIISSKMECPQRQTFEHMMVAELSELSKKMIVVQNKIDLCERKNALKNKEEIDNFLKDTFAKDAPIIPLCAQRGINVDIICQHLVESIPDPIRDLDSPVRVIIIRSFDINKKNVKLDRLKGGVIGGSIICGTLKIGDRIEIRPGIKVNGIIKPIISVVLSLFSDKNVLTEAIPGGLIGIGLQIDPCLTKGDRLVGSQMGLEGTLPPVSNNITIQYKKLKIVSKKGTQKNDINKESHKFKSGEDLLLSINSTQVQSKVVKKKKGIVLVRLTQPICCSIGDSVSISQKIERRWELAAGGKIVDLVEL
jgi:translation initiation factor 2 subunit 3